jgi:hypothetical protein
MKIRLRMIAREDEELSVCPGKRTGHDKYAHNREELVASVESYSCR